MQEPRSSMRIMDIVVKYWLKITYSVPNIV
jgi:hypothetical protein